MILALTLGNVLFLAFYLSAFGVTWGFEIPYFLLLGWIHYLARIPQTLDWNWFAIASGALCLALAVGGFHFIARRIAAGRESIWPWRWSAGISILVLLVFSVSLAIGGIVHQTAWLARENWVQRGSSRNLITKEIANARQLIISLQLYASEEDGNYPSRLEHLASSAALEMEIFDQFPLYSGDRSTAPAPWIYVRGLSTSAPGNLPILIAPHALRDGKRIIGTSDTAVSLMRPQDIRELLPIWKKGYATLGIPLPSVLQSYDTPAAH